MSWLLLEDDYNFCGLNFDLVECLKQAAFNALLFPAVTYHV